jgi:hypothetical protein
MSFFKQFMYTMYYKRQHGSAFHQYIRLIISTYLSTGVIPFSIGISTSLTGTIITIYIHSSLPLTPLEYSVIGSYNYL